jgi:hypothetical protein
VSQIRLVGLESNSGLRPSSNLRQIRVVAILTSWCKHVRANVEVHQLCREHLHHVHSRRLGGVVRISRERGATDSTGTGGRDELTLLLNIARLVALIEQLEKRYKRRENSGGVDCEDVVDIVDFPILQMVPKLQK